MYVSRVGSKWLNDTNTEEGMVQAQAYQGLK